MILGFQSRSATPPNKKTNLFFDKRERTILRK